MSLVSIPPRCDGDTGGLCLQHLALEGAGVAATQARRAEHPQHAQPFTKTGNSKGIKQQTPVLFSLNKATHFCIGNNECEKRKEFTSFKVKTLKCLSVYATILNALIILQILGFPFHEYICI